VQSSACPSGKIIFRFTDGHILKRANSPLHKKNHEKPVKKQAHTHPLVLNYHTCLVCQRISKFIAVSAGTKKIFLSLFGFDDMHVNGARPLRALLDLKLHLRVFLEIRKLRIDKAALVKKYFPAVCVADKPKTTIGDYFLYLSRMHSILSAWSLNRFTDPFTINILR